jgi:ribose transport system permease protein
MLLAIGMTFVIITAGIDLSVSAVLVFSAVMGAKTMVALSGTPEQVRAYEHPNQAIGIPVGLAVAVLCGLGWGLFNGLTITKLKLPPFIVTLGSLGMALGLAQIFSGGSSVPYVPTAVQTEFGARRIFGGHLPVLVLITAIVAIWAGIALGLTRYGRYTYAIGSNAAAARRAGINVDRHLIKVYAISGTLAGLAGAMDVARFATASSATHSADNLNAISAVVIGGTSLFGGMGSIVGTVIGAFIPAVLANGLVIGRVDSFWQQVVVGAILIIAVYIDQRRRKAEERM